MSRQALVWVLAAFVLVATASPAAADPAGPTDYLTEVVSIEPPAPAISVRIIGGDSFFEVTQLQPVLIEVQGYNGEPYLQILPDGTVQENRLAPSTYLNEERYGTNELVPDTADTEAAPEWVSVGDGGRYAWHDHRSHWMNPQRPPGSGPGDPILEAVVPIAVDGVEVKVTVVSFLQADPSPVPVIFGVVLGAVLAGLVLIRSSPFIGVLLGLLTAVVGVSSFLSVPSETGPALTLWVLPVLAVVALVAALALQRWPVDNPLFRVGLILVGGVQLVLWAALQWTSLTKAILPTDVPWSLFRLLVVGALVVGLAYMALSIHLLRSAFVKPASTG